MYFLDPTVVFLLSPLADTAMGCIITVKEFVYLFSISTFKIILEMGWVSALEDFGCLVSTSFL